MLFKGVLRVLVPMLWAFSTMADDDAANVPVPVPVTVKQDIPTTATATNSTITPNVPRLDKDLKEDSTMIQRALYVLIGITTIGVLYFLVRAVRLKKPSPKKKYGLLSNYDDNVEMAALESDEDETVYEARSLAR